MEPLAEAQRLGLDVVVIDHHQADEQLPPAVAVVNPNRRDDLSGLGHLAAVGLTFVTVVAVNRELRRRGFWSEAAAGAGPAFLPASRRARHGGRCGAAEGAEPRLRLQGTDCAAPARACGPDRADGCGAPERAAGALSSRISAGAAHQCRRAHRPRRSRRAAVDGKRSGGSRADCRGTRSSQPRAAGDRAANAGGGRSGSHGGARARGKGRGGGDRVRKAGIPAWSGSSPRG